MRFSYSSHLLADKVNTSNDDKYHQRVVTTWITSLEHLLDENLWPVNEGTVILGECWMKVIAKSHNASTGQDLLCPTEAYWINSTPGNES